jgi:hypothetical protein
MSLTRKHFEAIARILANMDNGDERKYVAHQFADWLASENPLFQRNAFLEKCGVDPQEEKE